MEEIKNWQMAVTKASLSFSTLNVELEMCGNATGSLVFAFDADDSCIITVNASSGAKLLELNNTRVKTKHVRAMLLFLLGCLSQNDAEEPVKKRGRAVKTAPAIAAPRMSASFANTPIAWTDISDTQTIDTIVAFLD